MSAAALLQVEELVTGYGQLRVVRGMSFTLARDEILAVIGANGAGKTTLLNALVGQLPAWSGRVLLEGAPVSGRPAHRIVEEGIALVPEGRHVFATLTVKENLLVGAHTRGSRRDVETDLARWFEAFPVLAELRRRPAGALSGGEQQMLALARALMSRPKVLLLDEPSLGLAPKIVAQVFEFVERVRDEGTSIVPVEAERAPRARARGQGDRHAARANRARGARLRAGGRPSRPRRLSRAHVRRARMTGRRRRAALRHTARGGTRPRVDTMSVDDAPVSECRRGDLHDRGQIPSQLQ